MVAPRETDGYGSFGCPAYEHKVRSAIEHLSVWQVVPFALRSFRAIRRRTSARTWSSANPCCAVAIPAETS